MKKTFDLTHEKIKYPRMVEAAKKDVRKYIKRERKKTLSGGVHFWDFDCKFGDTEVRCLDGLYGSWASTLKKLFDGLWLSS